MSRLGATWRQEESNGSGVRAGAPLLGGHQPAVKPATRHACDPASSSNGDQTPRAKLSEFADHPRTVRKIIINSMLQMSDVDGTTGMMQCIPSVCANLLYPSRECCCEGSVSNGQNAESKTYHSSEFASAGLYADQERFLPTKLPGLKTWQPVYVRE